MNPFYGQAACKDNPLSLQRKYLFLIILLFTCPESCFLL